MEGNKKKCENEKCKTEIKSDTKLYTSLITKKTFCFNCGGRKQCEKITTNGNCQKGAYNKTNFCVEHTEDFPKCKFVYESLTTGPEQCKTNRCRKGGYCGRHCKEENRERDQKLTLKPEPKKRDQKLIVKPEPLKKRTFSESKTKTKDEPKSKRRKETDPLIGETTIDAIGISEKDTSFTGESKYDSTYKEKEWKQSSLLNFLKGVDFDSPKKPSDGKRKSHKKSHKKSRRKSRKKSRRKSSRRNKKYIYKSLKSSYKK